MFDSRRTFTTCAFCDNSELTDEHIFGRGLAKRLGLRSNWSALDLRQGKIVNGGAPLLSVTSRILCVKCNNSLGASMQTAYGPLLRLAYAKGLTGRGATAAESDHMLRYFERLGFLVDLLTSNHEVTEEHLGRPEHQRNILWRGAPSVYSREDRKAWLLGEPDLVPTVFIGRHKGVLGLLPQCNVASWLKLSSDGNEHSKVFQIVLRSLAVAIAIGSDCPEPPASFVRLQAGAKVRTPSHAVSYADHFSLYNTDRNNTELVHRLGNPSYRSAFESDVRERAKVD